MTVAQASIPLFKVFTPNDAAAQLAPVLASGQLAGGQQVRTLESALSSWLGAPQVVAVSDGSAAITLALTLAGVEAHDTVLVSPIACVASLMPIANIRAAPRWLDIDPDTGMTTASAIRAHAGERARALLHVQWSGDCGDVQALAAAAHEVEMACIVDATEAFGAERDGRRWLDDADFTAYSFYANKPLSTAEGGALAVADADIAARARRLRRFGIDRTAQRTVTGDLAATLDIPEPGWNATLTDLAAALGLASLPHVEACIARHRDNAAWFDHALMSVQGLGLLRRNLRSRPAHWTYSLRAERRDDLIRKLHDAGIGAQRLHLRADRFSCFGGEEADLPGVDIFDRENLSIPCGWWVDDAARERIAAVIKSGW
ncbi:MAG: aminotransferase class V-fold PLP-dependent enzyme [Betaproteobacteria bacterium]|nr:aminotransferase class V-fold PLP-dependent enzyme [Betaproteobacteria bacterium]